jgi:transcriptional/translational regulatory protein YebC/TACO1
MLALEGGADDITFDDGIVEIIGSLENFKAINDELVAASIEPDEAGLRMFPKNEISLNASDTAQVLRVIEALEDLEDVHNVFSNLQISDEGLAELEVV